MRDGDSCWNLRHKKGQFEGQIIPFGALIDYMGPNADVRELPKGAPGLPGHLPRLEDPAGRGVDT